MSIERRSLIIPDWRAEFKRLEGAYAPSTLRSYVSDVRIFVQWCEDRGIPPFPAGVPIICSFLEDQAAFLRPSSVRRRLCAIRKIHRLLRLADPTWEEDINITLRRVRRSQPNRPRQAKGLTRAYRDAFLEVQPDTPWGLRNRAIAQ